MAKENVAASEVVENCPSMDSPIIGESIAVALASPLFGTQDYWDSVEASEETQVSYQLAMEKAMQAASDAIMKKEAGVSSETSMYSADMALCEAYRATGADVDSTLSGRINSDLVGRCDVPKGTANALTRVASNATKRPEFADCRTASEFQRVAESLKAPTHRKLAALLWGKTIAIADRLARIALKEAKDAQGVGAKEKQAIESLRAAIAIVEKGVAEGPKA